ncbi:dipeptidase [Roseovarius nanhaiticus]|uniref:Membrane dipeptidase n=1 Tax=Roseovarius nanhaiticus TaxID=573024 RepID=A0A1N7HN24_9RHOB|nr:membrane dipeptidase [Roseovarius nanhaiticus]SEL36530.1 membrane dipeptidase [Roseovarius nanhaiticus]SIS26249.1 membrane dipeptidase [Roseovarius nanhaiticus]
MTERYNESLKLDEVRAAATPEALAMLEDALVWDMTLPWTPDYVETDRILPRFAAAGVDLISLTVMGPEKNLAETIAHFARVGRAIEARSETMVRCRSVADIRAAKAAGKLGLIYNLQETKHFDDDLGMVGLFYELGVRHALLAYNARNRVGDGCSERNDSGLSNWGVAVVEEMNRVGMLVDGTHSGVTTTMDAMDVATSPFIFSHCNAYGVVPHYRNIRDEQIVKCAATGGVIGVNGLGEFLDDPKASSQSIFKHLDYMAQLVGPRHLGLGLDFVLDVGGFWDWVEKFPHMWPESPPVQRRRAGFAQPEQVLELIDLMLAAGWSDEDVRGVLGENFARVCEEVWK